MRATTGLGASIESGRTLPGWFLHAGLAVCAVGAFLAAAGGALVGGLVAVVCVVIAGTVAATLTRPGYLAFAVSLVPTALALLAVGPVGYSWRTPLIMVAVHASVRLCLYTSQISLTTQVELAVLAAEGRRFAIVNLLGQAAALLAGALTTVGDRTDGAHPGLVWLGVGGALALTVLAVALRSGARPQRAEQ